MKKLVLLVVAMCSSFAAAIDTLTLVRWDQLTSYANGNGAVTTMYPDPLPTGWAITIANNEGTSQCMASASRKKSMAGVTTNIFSGYNDYLVNIFTTRTTKPNFSVVSRYTSNVTASAVIAFYLASAYARASTAWPLLQTREVKADVIDINEEDSLGPATTKRASNFTGATWTTVTGGKQVDVFVKSGNLRASATATSPGGGSNMAAAVATGSAITKMKPLTLKFEPSMNNAGFISGTRDSFADTLFIELRNEYNAFIDNLSVGGIQSTWHLPFDEYANGNYRLYCWVPGGLRKRIDVAYMNSVGITGLSVQLYYGDINYDNTITQAEIDAILGNNGKTMVSGVWHDTIAGLGCPLGNCDLNQDDVINAADYLLAVGNVGRTGD